MSPVPEEGEESAGGKTSASEEMGQNPQAQEKPRVYVLPDEVKFLEVVTGKEGIDSGEAVIVFHANGGSDGGEIVLSDKGEKRKHGITVHFLTGAVKLEEKS